MGEVSLRRILATRRARGSFPSYKSFAAVRERNMAERVGDGGREGVIGTGLAFAGSLVDCCGDGDAHEVFGTLGSEDCSLGRFSP
jgi:hypothetical protein